MGYVKGDSKQRLSMMMCKDIVKSFTKAKGILETLDIEDFKLNQTLGENRMQVSKIKKVIEFIVLFANVNREMVDDDIQKKIKGKVTNR